MDDEEYLEMLDECEECRGYGDDYTYDENGEEIPMCDMCPCNDRYYDCYDNMEE